VRLLLAALLLPLAACSSPGGDARPALDIVRDAGRRTAEAGSARIGARVDGGVVTMTMSGVAALDDVTSAMATTFTAPTGETLTTLETRLLGDVMYVRTSDDPGGKPWVRYEIDALAEVGTTTDEVSQARQNDPRQVLPILAAAYGNVRTEGEEEMRGEPATRYRAQFDLAKARAAEPDADARAAVDRLVESLGAPTLSATVWLDRAGRLRRLEYQHDPSRSGQAPPGSGLITTTYELHDFGVDVVVVAPPTAQTTRFP